MRSSTLKLAVPLAVAMFVAPAFARGQQDEWTNEPDDAAGSQKPDTTAPEESPPPPPATIPEPPQQSAPQQPQAAVPQGQWVYTSQYGWVWMPYDTSYTYVPPDGGYPVMYVYYPVYGWCWLNAPWVWGVGPWPYFGFYGGVQFAWYHYHAPPYYSGGAPPYYGRGRVYPSPGYRYPAYPYVPRAPRGAPAPVTAPGFHGGAVRPVPGGVMRVAPAPRVGVPAPHVSAPHVSAPHGGAVRGGGGGGHR